MKRVLVTGGSGFVGANLVSRLLSDGHEVHLILRESFDSWRLDLLSRHVFQKAISQSEPVKHFVSLADEVGLRALIKRIRPDWIFHLAACGNYSWQTNTREIIEANISGTVSLIEAAADVGFEVFINTGSSAEYGFKSAPAKESDALEANSLYSATKIFTSQFMRLAAKERGLNIRTLRMYSAYGPYEDDRRLVPTLIREGLKGRLPPLVDPNISRDFIYVDDVVEAYLSLATSAIKEPGAAFNVGSGIQTSIAELVSLARSVLDIPVEPAWGTMENRLWDSSVWCADIQKIQRELGWSPRYGLRDGFVRTVEWMKQYRCGK